MHHDLPKVFSERLGIMVELMAKGATWSADCVAAPFAVVKQWPRAQRTVSGLPALRKALELIPLAPPYLDNALVEAARCGWYTAAELLLEKGASASAAAADGATALHYAAADAPLALDFAASLLKHGAPVDARHGPLGNTPLHRAMRPGSHRMLELLLGGGASIQAALADGTQPLHLALQFSEGDTAPLKLLLERGAPVEVSRSWGSFRMSLLADAAQRPMVRHVPRRASRGLDLSDEHLGGAAAEAESEPEEAVDAAAPAAAAAAPAAAAAAPAATRRSRFQV